MIRFDKIWKSYSGGRPLFRNLSLELPSLAATALIGPSGSGKSTLLKLINGLLVPEQGNVWIDDRPLDYSDLSGLRNRMGYMVQGGGLFPHLTIGANIGLKAKLLGWQRSRIEQRIEQLLSMVSLPTSYCDRHPYQLSGGEQQRAAICRALMLQPDILLLDEPFGALDPVTRREIQREFVNIKNSLGFTAILVTHDLREAMLLADHVVLLNDGRVEQSCSRKDILASPASDFARQFIEQQGAATV